MVPLSAAEVPPTANWIRLAGGRVSGVGGTAVGGTAVGTTAVGGIEVTVTITGVGGTEVSVGSAATPWVEVGIPGASVVESGGFPLAGNLQDEAANASITSNTHMKTIFFFMLFSLTSFSVHPIN